MGATGTLMAVSAGAQGLSSAAGAYSQAGAQRSQGAYQQQMYEMNSKLADMQADDAIARGDKAALQVTSKVRGIQGEQRTGLAGQGVDVNSGSAAQVQSDTASLGALDALTIKNNAWREAWGYKTQATAYSGQGRFAGMAADNSANSTLLTGGLSFISSGLKGYSTWGSNDYGGGGGGGGSPSYYRTGGN